MTAAYDPAVHAVSLGLLSSTVLASRAGDRYPRHLFLPDVHWPEPPGPVLRRDRLDPAAQAAALRAADARARAAAAAPARPASLLRFVLTFFGCLAGEVVLGVALVAIALKVVASARP